MRTGHEWGKTLFAFPFKHNLFCKGHWWNYLHLPMDGLLAVGDITSKLEQGFFDLVLIGDIWTFPYLHGVYAHILSFMGHTGCAIVSQDGLSIESVWNFEDLNVVAKFYCEKRHERDGYPISYSELEERMPERVPVKGFDTFFAGTCWPGRVPYIEALQERYDNIYPQLYTQNYAEYVKILRAAKVSFSLPPSANGLFNLNRLYEIPGQGTCLFTYNHQSTIEVRDDFTNGVNAIFFTSEADMLAKLDHILSDSQEDYLRDLTTNGLNHIREHHLVQHCAKYVLQKVESLI